MKFLNWFKKKFKDRFRTSEFDTNLSDHLGMRIERKELSNGHVVLEVDSNGYDLKLQEAVLDKSENRDIERILNPTEENSFRKALGMMAWLARITRADIAYESAACAQAFEEAEGLIQDYENEDIYMGL